jgi:hypothetical protein
VVAHGERRDWTTAVDLLKKDGNLVIRADIVATALAAS